MAGWVKYYVGLLVMIGVPGALVVIGHFRRIGRPQQPPPSARHGNLNNIELRVRSVQASMEPVVRHQLAKWRVEAALSKAIPLDDCPKLSKCASIRLTTSPTKPRVRWLNLASLFKAHTSRIQQQAATQALQSQEGSPFANLPAEILLLIFECLDYSSAISLSRTGLYFYQSSPVDWVSEVAKFEYVLYAEDFQQNQDLQRLACFSCMLVLRPRHFQRSFRSGQWMRMGQRELERRCRQCCRGGSEA